MSKSGIFLITVTILIVSSTEIVLKFSGKSLQSGYQLTFWRFLIGGIFLLALTKKQHRNQISWLLAQKLIILGFLFVVISMSCYQLAVMIAPASSVAIIFSLNPLVGTILLASFYKKRIPQRKILPMLLSLTGLILMGKASANTNNAGMGLALGAMVLFSVYSIFITDIARSSKVNIVTLTSYIFIFGALELLIGRALIMPFINGNQLLNNYFKSSLFEGITLTNLPLLLYISVVVTAGGFALYAFCQNKFGELSSLIFIVKPVSASMLALTILAEPVSLQTFVGIGFIVFSVILIINQSFLS